MKSITSGCADDLCLRYRLISRIALSLCGSESLMTALLRMQTAVHAFLPFLFIAFSRGPCRAEDRPFELPKDGSWVRYELEHVGINGAKSSNTVTLSVVGSAVENEMRCRWVEVKVVVPK